MSTHTACERCILIVHEAEMWNLSSPEDRARALYSILQTHDPEAIEVHAELLGGALGLDSDLVGRAVRRFR